MVIDTREKLGSSADLESSYYRDHLMCDQPPSGSLLWFTGPKTQISFMVMVAGLTLWVPPEMSGGVIDPLCGWPTSGGVKHISAC